MQEITTYTIESTVAKATVYTDRALVTRFGQSKTDQNHFIIEIPNLPLNLDESLIQARATGLKGLELQDIKVREKYYSTVSQSKIQTLLEEQERLELEQRKLEDKLEVLDKQEEFLDSIKVFSTESINKDFERKQPNPDDWDNVLGFLGKGMNRLNEERYELEAAKKKVDDQLTELLHTLNAVKQGQGKRRKSAYLEFMAEESGEISLILSYQIREARWYPMYEARVDSENKKVGLRYYGMVSQSSGEDWDGVELQLSTARPHIGGTPPSLNPWYLDIFLPPPPMQQLDYAAGAAPAPRAMKKSKGMRSESAKIAMEEIMDEFEEEGFAKPGGQRTATVDAGSGTSVVFNVPGGSDVPGDGSGSRHLIMENEFGSKFRYLTIPKLSELAYLTAEVTNETEFPMLPGQITIFIDGNFIGKSQIAELVTPEEKFELNLGVDENIKVKHKLLKKMGDEKGLFSKSKRFNYAYQITVQNQRKSAEEIIVRDQLPVSQNEKIKVETRTISPQENPEMDREKLPNGTVEWKLSIPPKESAKCELAFSVEYPTDLRVTGI